MFYTLVSRTIITKITKPRDYLYVFLLGSIGYIALHWYLYMDNYTGIREIARQYLYYWMGMDIVVGLGMSRFYPVKRGTETTEQPDDQDNWHGQRHRQGQDDTKGNYESAERTKDTIEPIEPVPTEPVVSDPTAKKPQDQVCENGICEVNKKSIFTKSEDSGESATSNSDHEVKKAERSKPSKKPTKIVYVKKKDTDTDANPVDTEIPVYNKAT